ncbi:hypothetical protein CC1G_15382 [Coprinopsis cinerea okayama7|uniref:Uncharacterized protein n=1 Tax=Coprinopsis cinerea (strain Okayama-7 / 130 / ATCC MYA-4618 / FGSC 9003) TaxID=240176 RepID=D6RQL3_COPC7|nr:hypothetical protein CC1G_15382 [Coprinopsis cinerea okayama7\|eukprot:XP_002910104.1 hypothetical protein CC1G_15382 [Coprinopsis cinerea okayama7\
MSHERYIEEQFGVIVKRPPALSSSLPLTAFPGAQASDKGNDGVIRKYQSLQDHRSTFNIW